jgi:DNA-binding NtrC family response regulator
MTTINDVAEAMQGANVSIDELIEVLRAAPYNTPAFFGPHDPTARGLQKLGLLEECPSTPGLFRQTWAGQELAAKAGEPHAAAAAPKPNLSLQDVAHGILALPVKGSRLDAAAGAVKEAVARAAGNKSKAAALLGVDRKAFARRLKKAR